MAAKLETVHPVEVPAGGSFLFREIGATPIQTPEGFTEEQRLYYKTALQFTREQVLTQADRIEKKDNVLLRQLLRQAGELGLLMIDIPEAYGGLGLEKTTSQLAAEAASLLGSWSTTIGAQTVIGSLPIVWFGTPAQKQKYLPGIATGEFVAAYALTEQGSGSDALGAKTRAVLSADGQHYLLNGSKLYITNAGFADVFIVFAKVDGEKFTGFIVDRETPGFSVGPEEHKMGIRGSSTCPLYFEDAQVPVGNLLGEIGKGHKIAFNILNLARLKLGASVLGAMKLQLQNALRFAQERKQFKVPIASFPLTREKLARMSTLCYAVESMGYRTTGLVDGLLSKSPKTTGDEGAKTIAAVEEFAIESSILKVFGSEAVGALIDDALQIHGGAGFIEEYPVERAYRDQRINRIFEGTNEINRMLISGMLLKRVLAGRLPGLEAKPAPAGASGPVDALAQEAWATERMKSMAIEALRTAAERFGAELDQHQEVLAAMADVLMDLFALDSMIARTRQASAGTGLYPVRVAMVKLFLVDAQSRFLDRTRRALCACAQGPQLAALLERASAAAEFQPFEPASLRETVVEALEGKGGYPFEHI